MSEFGKVITNDDIEEVLEDGASDIAENESVNELKNILGQYNEEITEKAQVENLEVNTDETTSTDDEITTKINIEKKVIQSNEVITGSMLLIMTNMLVPSLISLVHRKIKKTKIPKTYFKIPKSELNELKELADHAAKQINLSASPILLLVFSLCVLYFTTYMIGVSEYEVKKLAKKTTK